MSISIVAVIGFDSEHYIVTEIDGIAVVKVRLISGSVSTPVTVKLNLQKMVQL